MKVGLIKEIKTLENRVGLTPNGVAALVERGHRVCVEQGAGVGSGFDDDEYRRTGADIGSQQQAWASDLIVKVKEPIAAEYGFLQNQIVFTYFHLAGVAPELTDALLSGRTTAIAYETLEDDQGRLPLLAPMSAVAGNMAVQMAGYYLAKHQGGKGMMLGSVLGRRYGEVLVIGDGVVGCHAAKTAVGLGANVAMAGLFPENAERIHRQISPDVDYFLSTPQAIAERVRMADVVVGAVLIHGAKAAHVLTEDMVRSMQPGSVVVDVSIDQGGCIATSRATAHDDPVYEMHGVIHYCVANMPGAYPRTSTLALTEATLPYVLKLADDRLDALRTNAGFAKALNTYQGYVTCRPVAEALACLSRFKNFSEF